MKDNLVLVVKGFIMGIANIIPGVSGGTLALILGIYEDFIGAISHFFSNFKKNICFLAPIAIGILLAIASLSRVIDYSYKHYPIPTSLFFVGLVIGGIPMLYSKVKGKKEVKQASSYLIFLLTFALVIFMACSSLIFGEGLKVSLSNMGFVNYLLLFLVGVIAAATMVIPGVSGSLVLMLLGYYYPVIAVIKEFTSLKNIGSNILILGVFGIGVLLGIVLISKLIEFLFNKYETKTYFGVLGFIIASIIAIPISTMLNIKVSFDIIQILIGIIFLVFGYTISYKLGEK
ncbi:MAG: DUF368 domain-containing protein [bacterium]|nr:DUF368 domain-containing protein [bacterium]